MKKILFAILVVVLAGLIGVSIAWADSVNRTPDATFPHSSELNKPEYWGDNCTKYESGFDGDVGTMPSGYSLLVLKAGTQNFVWYNPTAGDYGTPNFKDISHSIVCRGETPEPTVQYKKQYRVNCNGVKMQKLRRVCVDGNCGSWHVVQRWHYIHRWTNPLELETWRRFNEPERCYTPGGSDIVLDVDCIGFEVIYIPDSNFPEQGEVIFAGKWGPKDVIETAHFPGDEELGLEPFDIVEPEECYECVPDRQIWVWKIFNQDGTVAGLLRDLGYDGTYDAPGLHMQRGYFGCDFYPGDVHGYYVDDCQPEYDHWQELPLFCGFSSCE
jgi:hypothetical protein